MTAVALAIGSSLGLGLSDFLGGLKSRSLPQLSVLFISQASALLLVATFVVVLGIGPPSGRFIVYSALAGVAAAVGVAALYRGLAIGSIGIVAPAAATAPIVPVLAGVALGELPTPIQSGGIVLAIAGIILTSSTRSTRTATGVEATRSVVLGLLAAVGFGSSYVAVDAASEASVPWALLGADLTTVTIFVAAVAIARPRLAVGRANLAELTLIGALIAGADAMYAVASTQGLLGVVAVLSSLYPLVTIALARLYLHERLERLQQIGIAVCLGGTLSVAIP